MPARDALAPLPPRRYADLPKPEAWPEERTIQLHALHEAGFGAEAMAVHLGVTVDAVRGKCRRLGLSLKPQRRGPL